MKKFIYRKGSEPDSTLTLKEVEDKFDIYSSFNDNPLTLRDFLIMCKQYDGFQMDGDVLICVDT